MSSDGRFVFISYFFLDEDAQRPRKRLIDALRDKFGNYGDGSRLMIYPPEKTPNTYDIPGLLTIEHDCRHIEGLIKDEQWGRAEQVITDMSIIHETAQYVVQAKTYYTSEYTDLYNIVELSEAFSRGEMVEITPKQLGHWSAQIKDHL